ncbi:Mitochondrial matrix iron chaperone [Marasmius crinis-equi]|uniref:ferroxidase n=1 Tax=Marasmius crinis-equi TaxID=585013 RepID=A0ABR3FID6_9AGAR
MSSSISRSLLRLAVLTRHPRLSSQIWYPSSSRHILNNPPNTRHYATPPPQLSTSTLSMDEYHQLSEDTMDALVEDLEALLDEYGNPNYEVEYHSGVLTLKLGDEGTYVINKQPPNKQIWLSSPVSGPKRYDYSEGGNSWLYSRDNRSIGQLLNEELSKAFKKDIRLSIS